MRWPRPATAPSAWCAVPATGDEISWDPDGRHHRHRVAGRRRRRGPPCRRWHQRPPLDRRVQARRSCASRTKPTSLLAETARRPIQEAGCARLRFGHRLLRRSGRRAAGRDETAGTGFLSEICVAWEAADGAGRGRRDPRGPDPHRHRAHAHGRSAQEAAAAVQARTGRTVRHWRPMAELDHARRRGGGDRPPPHPRSGRAGEPHRAEPGRATPRSPRPSPACSTARRSSPSHPSAQSWCSGASWPRACCSAASGSRPVPYRPAATTSCTPSWRRASEPSWPEPARLDLLYLLQTTHCSPPVAPRTLAQ